MGRPGPRPGRRGDRGYDPRRFLLDDRLHHVGVAMGAERRGRARGLTFVGLIAATAGIVIVCYHSRSWLATRVQVTIDAYDKRQRKT